MRGYKCWTFRNTAVARCLTFLNAFLFSRACHLGIQQRRDSSASTASLPTISVLIALRFVRHLTAPSPVSAVSVSHRAAHKIRHALSPADISVSECFSRLVLLLAALDCALVCR
jgi:hypothetical protein